MHQKLAFPRVEFSVSEELLNLECVREAALYERLRGGSVRCLTCERRCVVSDGGVGLCGTRVNVGGKLYTVVYGCLTAMESRPIEIKPLFHYYPGSTAMTISSWGCNFPCPWCQNYSISKVVPDPRTCSYTPPERVVDEALACGDLGINVSLNEPTTLFEYSLDVFREGRKAGLYLSYNSNGYLTIEALEKLVDAGLTGINIDFKGCSETYRRFLAADIEVVKRNIKYLASKGVHVELTYLIVTGANDWETCIMEFIEFVVKELGPNTPVHFTRYYPAYVYSERPTPLEKLEWAWKTARREGLNFVYIGNVPGHPAEHTYCPNCGTPVIKRYGMYIVSVRLKRKEGKYVCSECGREIPIYGEIIARGASVP